MSLKDFIVQAVVMGSTASEAVLSCCGILSLYPIGSALCLSAPMIIACLAGGFALVIEYDIYKQNVLQAMRFNLKRSVARRLLMSISVPNNAFLTYYKNQKTRLHTLEKNLDKYQNTKEAEKEIASIKKRIERMENLFIRQILENKELNQPINQDQEQKADNKKSDLEILASLFDKKEVEQHITLKKTWLLMSKIISACAGIACVLVTFSSISTAITDLTSGPELLFAHSTLSMGMEYFISGLAGVGYILLMYRTFSYLIHSEAYTQGKEAIKQFWHKEKTASDIIKVSLLTVTMVVVIIATVATAGTWGSAIAVITGTQLSLGVVTSGISLFCMVIPTFIYSVVNTIRSAIEITTTLYKLREQIKKDIKAAWESENIFQFLNPFRLLLQLLYVAVFFGHIAATGAASASDNNIVSAWLAIVTNGGAEFLIDLHQVVDHDDHCCDSQSPTNYTNQNSNFSESEEDDELPPLVQAPTSTTNKRTKLSLKPSQSEEEDDHQHNENPMINALSFFIKIPAVLWDFSFSALVSAVIEPEKEDIWKNAKEKFFPPKKDLPEKKSDLFETTTWLRYEALARCDEEIKAYQSSPFGNIDTETLVLKREALEAIRQEIAKSNDETIQATFQTIANSKNYEILKKHRCHYDLTRLFNPNKLTRSQKFFDGLRSQFQAPAAA